MTLKPTVLARIATVLMLVGCEGSTLWYASQPDRRVVMVDGERISVIPRGGNRWDAVDLGVKILSGDDAFVQLQRGTKAIEQVTGCKVVNSMVLPNTTIVSTAVSCDSH